MQPPTTADNRLTGPPFLVTKGCFLQGIGSGGDPPPISILTRQSVPSGGKACARAAPYHNQPIRKHALVQMALSEQHRSESNA